jgi:hypothetical protein
LKKKHISDFTREISLSLFDSETTVTALTGKDAILVPETLGGMVLTTVIAGCAQVNTGTVWVQVRKGYGAAGVDMLLSQVTLTNQLWVDDGAVNTANRQVAKGDQLYINLILSGLAPKGLFVTLTFKYP